MRSPMVKLYANEKITTSTVIILDVDSNYVHPRLWVRPQMQKHSHHFKRILEILRNLISWNQMLWSLAVSLDIPGDSWCLNKSPYVFLCISRFLMSDDFWCIVSDLIWGECFAPPLLYKRSAPRFMKSRGVAYHPWQLLMPQQVFMHVLVHF